MIFGSSEQNSPWSLRIKNIKTVEELIIGDNCNTCSYTR
jgi:hypothetical protein